MLKLLTRLYEQAEGVFDDGNDISGLISILASRSVLCSGQFAV